MNTTFADPLSLTVRSITKSAPASSEVSPAPANFLFIMPKQATQEDHALIFTIANSMIGMGYVYIASADQPTTEDKGQIRYLPYRAGHFPNFGAVTAVLVLRDRSVACAALNEYPGAEGFLLEPRADIAEVKKPATLAHPSPHAGALISLPRYSQAVAA